MKVKVTKKQIKENYSNIIMIGYCQGHSLLKTLNPDYYSTGTYGWRCDYYIINGDTIISTGYDPIGNIKNSDIINKYENNAYKISCKNFKNYEDYKKALENNLNEFITEILESEVK